MSNPPETPAELTASDVLASDIWTGRAPPPVLGLDVGCTKIAVDFQNLRRPTADECIHRNLERLAELTASDCAFLALIAPDRTFSEIQAVRRGFAPCQPESLRAESLAAYPWLESRLEHLRLSELRDTAQP